jgi:cytochrome b
MNNKNGLNKVRVWDLPTRFFHWTLAAGVVALGISGTVGGNAMVWHFRLGYAVLALLLFRLVWGLVGGRWSRFGAFLFGPQGHES